MERGSRLKCSGYQSKLQQLIFIFCLRKLEAKCKQPVYTYVKCWMRWLEGAGGACGGCVRDEGKGQGQLCQIIWWMMVMVMGAVLRVTGRQVPDLAL